MNKRDTEGSHDGLGLLKSSLVYSWFRIINVQRDPSKPGGSQLTISSPLSAQASGSSSSTASLIHHTCTCHRVWDADTTLSPRGSAEWDPASGSAASSVQRTLAGCTTRPRIPSARAQCTKRPTPLHRRTPPPTINKRIHRYVRWWRLLPENLGKATWTWQEAGLSAGWPCKSDEVTRSRDDEMRGWSRWRWVRGWDTGVHAACWGHTGELCRSRVTARATTTSWVDRGLDCLQQGSHWDSVICCSKVMCREVKGHPVCDA